MTTDPAGRLTLRHRLTLLTAAAVAVAVAACAAASWFLVRDQLYRQLDRTLATAPDGAGPLRPGRQSPAGRALADCRSGPPAGQEGPPLRFTTQVVTATGARCVVGGSQALTVDARDARVAAGELDRVFRDGTAADGSAMRVLTRPDPLLEGVAVSVAVPLTETRRSLENLARLLAAVSALGVVGAATAGLLVARAALRPVDRLTGAVEHIARTEDLDTRIPADGADEIARLGRSFNTMTAALAASRDRQQQLIADAGHELRTPLTSLRTNIDLLMRSESTGRPLPPGARAALLAGVRAQMVELSSLVGDLLELARPDPRQAPRETVALHAVTRRAVERARLRGPGLRIDADLHPWYVHGDPASLERAVVNLLDNAVKFSPPDARVRVRLAGGRLTVRDHGPGVPEEDLPHVFDRFWRSPAARSLPGSGLGLSIVARVARENGGAAALSNAPGGGALAALTLPGAPGAP